MILKPKGQKGLLDSQGELEEPGPKEYLGSGGEKGNKTYRVSQKKVYHVLRGHNSPKNGTRNKSRVIFRSSSF